MRLVWPNKGDEDSTTNLVSTFLMYFQDKEKAYLAVIYTLALLLSFASSCREEEKKIELSLSLTDTFCIQLDETTSIAPKALLYCGGKENQRYLAIWNEEKGSIAIYDAMTGSLAHKVPIVSSGPGNVPMCQGFSLKSADSIFLAGADNRLHLVNRKGEILSRLDYGNIPGHTVYIPIMSFSRYNMQLLIREHPQYIGFLYDPYQNAYYRFYYPGTKEFPASEEVLEASVNFSQIGIMALDSAFNVKGEWLLPKNTYTQGGAFVAPEGLFIPTNHPKYAGLKEDELCFHVFQPW